MLTTSVKILLARRFRLVTTAFAVLLGVAFMAGTLTLTSTVGKAFDRLYANVYAGTDAFVRSASATGPAGMEMRGTVPAATVATVAGVNGVAATSGLTEGYAQLLNKADKTFGNVKTAPSLGFNWITVARLNPFRIAQGRPPAADDEIVIDRASARAAGYRIGDRAGVLTQATPQRLRIVGIATFTTSDSAAGSRAVLFTTAAAQRLVGQPGRFDAVTVVARPGVSQAELAGRIRRAVPGGVEVLTGQAITAESQKNAHQMLSTFSTFLLVFALIALFVGSFVIHNTFSILVAQRSREHALLRAIGASRRQVLGVVVLESVVVGTIAVVGGIAAGVVIAMGLKALLAGFGITVPAGGLVLTQSTIAVSALVGLGVTVAAAVFPARRAAMVPPVAAMRESTVEAPGGIRRRVVGGVIIGTVGAGLIAAGLFGDSHRALVNVALGAPGVFVGVSMLAPLVARPVARILGAPLAVISGMPGRLGEGNAMRNPRRTAATASSLMIGVALVGFLTVFAASAKRSYKASVDTSVKGSFVVSTGATDQGGFPPELAQGLAHVPGVRVAAGYRTTTVEIGTASKKAAGVDPVAYPQVVDLHVTKGSLAGLGDHGVAVVDTLASSHHWTLSETIPVRFAETGTRPLTLVAIYTQKIQAPPIVTSLAVYQANVASQLEGTIYVATDPGVSNATVRAGLEAATARYPTAKVETRAQYVKDQLGPVNTLVGLSDVMLAFAMLVALLGIANTLALSLYERTRELGLLRAVGMTRRQLRSAVRAEAAIVAGFGTVLGLAIGIGFGYVLVKATRNIGIGHFTVPSIQLGVIAVLAGVAGVVAAGRPARRAGRIDVLDAIAAG
jgi:putative ABC transport system permease protein